MVTKIKITPPNLNPMNFPIPKGLFKLSFIMFLAILLVIFDGFFLVPAGHVGVMFDYTRGGVLENERGEGIQFKIPIIQKATIFNVRTQEYTMSIAAGEGYKYENDAIEARSKDGQVVFIDGTALFHIAKDDASIIYQTLGTEIDVITKVVRPKARETVREVVGRFNSLDLVSEKRSEISDLINDELKASFAVDNVTMEEFIIRNVSFSEEFAAVIEQKEIARQNILTAEYRKQEAEALKAKKIIEAEADAESIRLKGDALRSNPEVIQLEFVDKMAGDIKWGILPDNIVPLMNFQQ
ncbi:MAG: prohibitin family protein [Candidatus Peregrinibacteria bacterium]|nr:prohibitin family protein [Candidatus Peregrinibacteria bacterium]MDZ4245477.1 prohibitin family protein [Candidatus Gracilibacteria bacterium]